ncbi:hypothetical protein BCR44DRAFT_240760 [Catenaria anguillulae PL171]|uniref:Uncharacterized protein n=1 Tax=Catenaria anguillulae PL171 TaxID=765915 RepID=A0A1Y2HPL1_9FUNG|nr:hypothetical protein BCR44DRAFT_240760 [Catenaria anguillulae PL171]
MPGDLSWRNLAAWCYVLAPGETSWRQSCIDITGWPEGCPTHCPDSTGLASADNVVVPTSFAPVSRMFGVHQYPRPLRHECAGNSRACSVSTKVRRHPFVSDVNIALRMPFRRA